MHSKRNTVLFGAGHPPATDLSLGSQPLRPTLGWE